MCCSMSFGCAQIAPLTAYNNENEQRATRAIRLTIFPHMHDGRGECESLMLRMWWTVLIKDGEQCSSRQQQSHISSLWPVLPVHCGCSYHMVQARSRDVRSLVPKEGEAWFSYSQYHCPIRKTKRSDLWHGLNIAHRGLQMLYEITKVLIKGWFLQQ